MDEIVPDPLAAAGFYVADGGTAADAAAAGITHIPLDIEQRAAVKEALLAAAEPELEVEAEAELEAAAPPGPLSRMIAAGAVDAELAAGGEAALGPEPVAKAEPEPEA